MLRLGSKVKLGNRPGMVVARVVMGEPKYDVRLDDGTVVRYVPQQDILPLAA